VELDPEWVVVDEHHLAREIRFPNFRTAFEFVRQVAELADAANHHPDIHLAWGRVQITIWTHSIGGLSESDFVLAARVDRLLAAA
jgi:4a-hydroxytetrahydrobiopterin dehydratase